MSSMYFIKSQNQNNSFIIGIRQRMLAENATVGSDQEQPYRFGVVTDIPTYDFANCQRMKKLTTHDIYRFTHEQNCLVVKLFAPQAFENYQQELAILKRANHSSVLTLLFHRLSENPHDLDPLARSHLIVMKEAERGDLNDYLPRYGRMNEKIARTYFKQLIETLNHLTNQKPAIIHPNLLASSLLLTAQAELKICGWSQKSQKSETEALKQSIFSTGEILICLLTSFMPFYKKNSATDTYYKFLTQSQIHKFWQEVQKRMSKIDKQFAFSTDVKDLIEGIFLKRITSFSEILKHPWTNGQIYTFAEIKAILDENEKSRNQVISLRKKQQSVQQQKRKKAIHDHQLSFGSYRSSSEENQQFIKDYEQNLIKEDEIPFQNKFSCLKIQTTPSFLIASLKDFLKGQKGKYSIMVCQQFHLAKHKIVKVNNYVMVDLDFSINLLEQDQSQDELLQQEEKQIVQLKLKISFLRQDKQIFAQVEVIQSNFNAYYTNLALRFIEQRVHRKKDINN